MDRSPNVHPFAHWQDLQRRHGLQVDAAVADHRAARDTGGHPVEDFLFVYYRWSPAQLRRWHPGAGTVLAPPDDGVGRGDGEPSYDERRRWSYYEEGPDGLRVDLARFRTDRAAEVRRTLGLLRAIDRRPPRFDCFGLHEWAMVYRTADRRHTGAPLRMAGERVDAVVEAADLRCTHIDAFRFFTDDAVPRNAHRPTRSTQVDFDQPGCVHVTMDLYRWASRLSPAVSSDLVMRSFLLAQDARRWDMRASPYDLTSLGMDPVPIETVAGRRAYVAGQQELAARAGPLRRALISACEELSPDR